MCYPSFCNQSLLRTQFARWHPRQPDSTLVVHVVAVSPRASASRSACAAPALLPVVIAGSALASRWGAHKGKVDRDLLLEQLLAVGALDGGLGLVEGGVFNENVALLQIS